MDTTKHVVIEKSQRRSREDRDARNDHPYGVVLAVNDALGRHGRDESHVDESVACRPGPTITLRPTECVGRGLYNEFGVGVAAECCRAVRANNPSSPSTIRRCTMVRMYERWTS